MKILVAALLGAVALFAWEFVAHMFTPLAEAGLSYLPKESIVSPALTSAIGAQRGLYIFPTAGLTNESSRQEKQQAMDQMLDQMKTNPSGLLMYRPAGATFSFGKSLAVQFLTDLVKALVAVSLLAQTRLATFGGRVAFVVGVGVVGAIATNIPYWNWYGFPDAYTAAQIVMEIVGFICAGLVIALVFKPAATAR